MNNDYISLSPSYLPVAAVGGGVDGGVVAGVGGVVDGWVGDGVGASVGGGVLVVGLGQNFIFCEIYSSASIILGTIRSKNFRYFTWKL